MATIKGGNRVIFNTGILYAKMGVTIIISLYATRIILDALGAEDYGIYVVVGGIVSMLGFLNTTMATSTQRHLSFSLGKNNVEVVKKVFANSIILHIVLAFLLVLIFELFGQPLLIQKLTIASDKLASANLLFHLVVATTFFTILTVPFDGIVNAKENMLFIAIIGIVDSVLRLAIALSLLYYQENALVLYGFLMMIRAILILIVKRVYCLKKYRTECKISLKKYYDKACIKDICSFAGWNLAGVLAYIFRNQGIAVVLSLFFNTIIVAAYGIANQVNTQLRTFSNAMIQAIQPQIIKNESGGDRGRMIKLSLISSRFSFFIFSFIALPLYFQVEFVLQLWLKEVPSNTVIFCKLILLLTLLQQLRSGITIASHAIGNIREYQMYSALPQLLSLPLGYLILYADYPAYSILVVVILVEIITIFLNIMFFKTSTGYPIIEYLKKVILSCSLPLLLVYSFVFSINYYLLSDLKPILRFFIIVPLILTTYTSAVYFLSFTPFERDKIDGVLSKINSFIKKK